MSNWRYSSTHFNLRITWGWEVRFKLWPLYTRRKSLR